MRGVLITAALAALTSTTLPIYVQDTPEPYPTSIETLIQVEDVQQQLNAGPYHGLAIQSRPPAVPDGGLATFAHLNDAGAPVQALVLPDGGVYDYLGIGGPIAPQSATRLVEA